MHNKHSQPHDHQHLGSDDEPFSSIGMATHDSKIHLESVQSLWICMVAWFFRVPARHERLVPERHWRNHSIVFLFTVVVVTPLCSLSWGHMASLLANGSVLFSIASGVFMGMAVLLMDSMLCGALGHNRFTLATFAVFIFRGVFAVASASSLALGAVLFCMGGQIDRQRADEELKMQTGDLQKVTGTYRLSELAGKTRRDEGLASQAQAAALSIPESVVSFRNEEALCQGQLFTLRENHSTLRPALEGEQAKLKAELQQAGVTPPPSILGRLKTVEAQLVENKESERHKLHECETLGRAAEQALVTYRNQAQQNLDSARATTAKSHKAEDEAESKAQSKIDSLNKATSAAWSKNFSAQVMGAWRLITSDFGAMLTAIFIFIVALITELSPVLGKAALARGPLDQMSIHEEEIFEKELAVKHKISLLRWDAQMEAKRLRVSEIAEIEAIGQVAEQAAERIQQLYQRKQKAVEGYPNARETLEDIFASAIEKIRQLFKSVKRAPATMPAGASV